MLGEILRPDMRDKLRTLEWFREYEAEVEAKAKAETEAATIANILTEYLIIRGDKPTEHALSTISACRNAGLLAAWLKRAYLGETSEQLFPEPPPNP